MAGLYIHIPFCASRCIYCDFYSTTIRGKAHEYVDALLNEYHVRNGFLPSWEPFRTIYIGGGTPSQMPSIELVRLIDGLGDRTNGNDRLENIVELTIEANPEDVNEEWARTLAVGLGKSIEVTRISMGVQSLIDSELQTINRRHNSSKPAEAVRILRTNGIKNISLDLMYGLPNQTMQTWEQSIDGIMGLDPEHISAYCLSIEEGTRLERMIEEGKLSACDDETCLAMAALLHSKLKKAGYVQYEISNYAKPGYESKHNSSYWDGTPYMGLGPGAHSYDGKKLRCWNEHDITSYLMGERKEDHEQLTDKDLYNEKIMLGLRTAKGVNYRLVADAEKGNIVGQLHERDLVAIKNNHLVLTEAGLALADEVIRELMI